MSEPALKCQDKASFKQIYTQKLLIAYKMPCSCCFSFRGNLDFPEFLQKKIYNINYSLFCVDSAALLMLNEQQFHLFGQIQSSQTGGQP